MEINCEFEVLVVLKNSTFPFLFWSNSLHNFNNLNRKNTDSD